ncbi:MAG: hypothetical protein ACLSA6_03165 [Holdemania massiliensis]
MQQYPGKKGLKKGNGKKEYRWKGKEVRINKAELGLFGLFWLKTELFSMIQ